MNVTASPAYPPKSDFGRALVASSQELKELANLSIEIQWAISSLLERAHHPDLSAEMRVLQDIDRLQQTLAELSRLIGAMGDAESTMDASTEVLKSSIKLESLRDRIFAEPHPEISSSKSDEITWL